MTYEFSVASATANLFGQVSYLVIRKNISTGVQNVVAVADSSAEAGRIATSLNANYPV